MTGDRKGVGNSAAVNVFPFRLTEQRFELRFEETKAETVLSRNGRNFRAESV